MDKEFGPQRSQKLNCHDELKAHLLSIDRHYGQFRLSPLDARSLSNSGHPCTALVCVEIMVHIDIYDGRANINGGSVAFIVSRMGNRVIRVSLRCRWWYSS